MAYVVRSLGGLVVAATLCPAVAGAQTVARSFEELHRDLKPRQTLVVTDTTGAKTKGTVVSISESSLLLLTKDKGQRTFAKTDVAEIFRRDGLLNGTLIGLGAGFAAYGVARAADSCAPFSYDLCYDSYGAFPLVVYPAVGAIAGAVIDRFTGNPRVYLAPSVRPGGGGVTVSMKF